MRRPDVPPIIFLESPMGHASVLLHRVAALVFCLCCVTAAQAGPYSGLYAFGDSLSDVGNDAIITGGAIPKTTIYTDGTTAGRFANGPNYLDGLATSLGLSLAPSLAGGTDYAYGGARTNYITPGLVPFGGLSFNQQIAAYDSMHVTADPNALYVLWIGANDMADAIGAAAGGNAGAIGAAIGTAMSGIGGAIGNLASLGAQHFLVPNLPDLSLTPRIGALNNPLLDSVARGASVAFNQNLASTLNVSAFSGLDIRDLDIFGALNNIVANPAGYGFTNVSTPCYTGEVDGTALPPGSAIAPTVCADPSQYLFWDYEHPTTALHAEVTRFAFAAVVPEPSTRSLLLVVAMGLIAIVIARRARAIAGVGAVNSTAL
jgi:phospholipase/lecithinase/hemolysin